MQDVFTKWTTWAHSPRPSFHRLDAGLSAFDRAAKIAQSDLAIVYLGTEYGPPEPGHTADSISTVETDLLAIRDAQMACTIGLDDALWRAVPLLNTGEEQGIIAARHLPQLLLANRVLGLAKPVFGFHTGWVRNIYSADCTHRWITRFIREVAACSIEVIGDRIIDARGIPSDLIWELRLANRGVHAWSGAELCLSATPGLSVPARIPVAITPPRAQTTIQVPAVLKHGAVNAIRMALRMADGTPVPCTLADGVPLLQVRLEA